jgi:hypothetical protein
MKNALPFPSYLRSGPTGIDPNANRSTPAGTPCGKRANDPNQDGVGEVIRRRLDAVSEIDISADTSALIPTVTGKTEPQLAPSTEEHARVSAAPEIRPASRPSCIPRAPVKSWR